MVVGEMGGEMVVVGETGGEGAEAAAVVLGGLCGGGGCGCVGEEEGPPAREEGEKEGDVGEEGEGGRVVLVVVTVVVTVIREVAAMTASATARDSARVNLVLKRTACGSFVVARPVVGLGGGGWVVLLPRPDAASNSGDCTGLGGWVAVGLVVLVPRPEAASMGEKSCGSSARAVCRSRQT